MIRKHENSDSWKAGIYAIAVHLALLVAMLISFNWKAAHPVLNVTEVELWDKLPALKVVEEPKPQPKPEIKEEPKPEPKPVVEEKLKPEEPKVDIELEKKKKELEQKEAEKQKLLEEKRKKEEATKQLAEQMREEDLQNKKATEKQAKADRDKALRKAQQEITNETGADDAKAARAANDSEIGKYTEKIKVKIHDHVTTAVCGDGNPELKFEINLMPTGQLAGSPKLTKSSGINACDDAVERAIMASEPLPVPSDPGLFSSFRNLNLKFRPND